MEKYDYKKLEKALYLPKSIPHLINVPSMNFIAVKGKGDPNQVGGQYQKAIELLYALSYTIKMSKMKGNQPSGFYDYTVYPLEGLWDKAGTENYQVVDKSQFEFISMIRQPEFVTKEFFIWACEEVKTKKGLDTSLAAWFIYDEQECVQCLHKGPYDEEPGTISAMTEYAKAQGYKIDFANQRYHHEIYMTDPRKTAPEKLKTVLRYPVTKK